MDILYIKRLFFIIEENEDDPAIVPLIGSLLKIIYSEDHRYVLFKHTVHLLELVKKYGNTELYNKYGALYQAESAPYFSTDLNKQMDIISQRYEPQIMRLSRQTESQAIFDELSEILERRHIDLLLSLDSSDYLTDNTSFYYNINQRYMKYYRRQSLKQFETYMAFRDYDNSFGATHYFLGRKLEQLLAYRKDNEDDLGAEQDKPLRNNEMTLVSGDDEQEDNSSVLEDNEVIHYWRCRWYLIYGSFLNNNYKEVVTDFDKMQHDNLKLGHITANGVLETNFSNNIVLKKDLMRFICLSILISKSAHDLQEYWAKPPLKDAIDTDNDLKQLIDSYSECRFAEFLQRLTKMEEYYSMEYQVQRVFPNVRKICRMKGYVTYLTLMRKVPLAHMAQFFGMDLQLLNKELMDLINIFDLNFRIDSKLQIIEYQEDISPRLKLSSLLHVVNEDVKAGSRALEVNSLIQKAFPEMDHRAGTSSDTDAESISSNGN